MQGQIEDVNGYVVIIFGHYILSDKVLLELERTPNRLLGRAFEAVERARIAVYGQWLRGEVSLGESRDQTRPEPPCRLVDVDVENLPLTGDLAQEGRDDKFRDTLATKAPTDEKITDVVLGAGDVSVGIHDNKPAEFAVYLDKKWPGCRVAPVTWFYLEVEQTLFAQLQWQPFAEVVQVELHHVFNRCYFVALSDVQFY